MPRKSVDSPQRKAVFLDRDGVISIPEFRDGRSFAVRRLCDFKSYPDARPAVIRLKNAGFFVVVVTNQPDIGNRLLERDVLEQMHQQLAAEMPFDLILTCPHTKVDRCDCRKPKPGMILEAKRALNLALDASFMVGDRSSDIDAGKAAGCRTVFIDRGYTAETKPKHMDFSCEGVGEAADWILSVTN